MNGYTYDVFISYSHRNKQWVDTTLVPLLQKNNLKVLTDDEFVVGISAVENMSNAVKQSKRTLIVLSPEWVQSQWTAYEGFLTTYVDPSGKEQRIIPVMIESCTPPEWLAFRTRIDLMDESQWERQMGRLVRTLSDVPPEVVNVDAVNEGLRTVADLLRGGPVRDALLEFRLRFDNAVEQIGRLASLKDVHDQLHGLQFQCYEPILREADALEKNDDAAIDNLDEHCSELERVIAKLRELEKAPVFDSGLPWIARLDRARELLAAALTTRVASQVRKAATPIDRVLAFEPPLIDSLLNQAANDLQLHAIIDAIDLACRRASESRMEPQKLEELQKGLEALDRLDHNLTALVTDHGRWQSADVELRRVATNFDSDSEELVDSWPGLKAQIDVLAVTDEPWVRDIRSEQTSLESAIAANDVLGMKRHLMRFRRCAGKQFMEVDTKLKRQCDELRRAGEPVAAIVKMLA